MLFGAKQFIVEFLKRCNPNVTVINGSIFFSSHQAINRDSKVCFELDLHRALHVFLRIERHGYLAVIPICYIN